MSCSDCKHKMTFIRDKVQCGHPLTWGQLNIPEHRCPYWEMDE